MKRILLTLVGISMALALFAGCSSGQDQAAALASGSGDVAASSTVETEAVAPSSEGGNVDSVQPANQDAQNGQEAASNQAGVDSAAAAGSNEAVQPTLLITSGGTTLEAEPENNVAADALMNLLEYGTLSVDLHEYGGFEKIGSLPQPLPTADEHVTTAPGDIVLYQGNQISFFYGTNSWSYTRLGHIHVPDGLDLLEALGGTDNSTVELSLGST